MLCLMMARVVFITANYLNKAEGEGDKPLFSNKVYANLIYDKLY